MTCKEFATTYADRWCTVHGSPYLPDETQCKVVGYWTAPWSGQSAIVVVMVSEVRNGARVLTTTQPPIGWTRTATTFLTDYYVLDRERLTPNPLASSVVTSTNYPHACPRCGKDALILALGVDCSNPSCPVRRP